MKFLGITFSIFVGIAASLTIEKRQATQNDIKSGGTCKKVTLIFARASTEPGNMVKISHKNGLKDYSYKFTGNEYGPGNLLRS